MSAPRTFAGFKPNPIFSGDWNVDPEIKIALDTFGFVNRKAIEVGPFFSGDDWVKTIAKVYRQIFAEHFSGRIFRPENVFVVTSQPSHFIYKSSRAFVSWQ